jgi:ubiquinone/menaquinone biosynthesis C-methylase UbiE
MQRVRARLVVNELDNSFFHGKSCIDAGCGAGRFASVMGELGADVVGFDCCEESIACAQAHASSLGLDTVQFKTANLYELPLPDNSVDFAVSNGVLHHHTNFDKAIRELHRVLKQGGLLWVYTVGTCDGLESQTDESIKRAMLRVPVATTLSLLQELETPPNTYLSATDTMYAVYYYRSFDETKRKLEELEFEAIEPLRLHHEYDQNDILPNHVKRFGSGTIRLLASKK